MSKIFNNLIKFSFLGLMIFIFSFQVNAQPTEKLIKKLPDGKEVYQRKYEVVTISNQLDILDNSLPDKPNPEKGHIINWKIEAVLKKPESSQEEIIWSREISFDKRLRAFNGFYISDVHIKGDDVYLLYFERLELRVIKLFKDSNGWNSRDDTYLEKTSESVNPIIESKFIGKKPKIFAKRMLYGLNNIIYEWKLKKGKWTLTVEKTVKTKPTWIKQKRQK